MPDITIDKSSLVYDDNEFEYKTRVPGTFGENIRYLWIKKDDVDEINEGKTILTSLDDEGKYMLYDKNNNLAETVKGSDLYINHYDPVKAKKKENTKSRNFDTINEEKSKSVGVKGENFQSVQTEQTEQIETETLKNTELSIPIFATLYDKCNRKIDELNSKNDKLNAKIEKLSIKKSRNAEFVSTIESLKDIVPRPVYSALSLLSAERRQKIVNINEKISTHKLSIKSNENKIQKHHNRADICKKINKFLDNMKSADGRKENFVKGIQEYRMMSMRTTSEKFDATQHKLNTALKAYGQTHYISEKLKLQKQINKFTTKKEKLMQKLKALDEWSVKFEAIKSMPDKEADNIINKSCQNIVDEFTTNPQALKKQADTIVSSTAKVIFEENYLKNAEMSIEDDYDSIDGIINNGNKQEEYDKVAKTQNKEPEVISEDRSSDNDSTRFTVYENFTDFGNYFTENRLSGAIDKEYTVEFGKIKNVEFFENQNGELMYKSTGLHGDKFINSVAESLKEARNSNAIQLVVTYANGYKNGFQQLNTIKVNPEKVFNGDGEIIFDKAEHNAEKQPKQQKKSLISRNQIKQNADRIAKSEQRNNTKSKEQEL